MEVKFSKSERRFFALVAHAIMTGQADNQRYDDGEVGYVTVEWMSQFMPERTVGIIARRFMDGHTDDHGSSSYGGGYLWVHGVLCNIARDGMCDLKVEGIMFDRADSVEWALGDLIPEKFWPALVHINDDTFAAAIQLRKTPEFQEWLANEWQDPTLEGPKAKSEPTGHKAAVKSTSAWVSQLTYTPFEATLAKLNIDAADLPKRTKAAFKAHVERRIVQEGDQ